MQLETFAFQLFEKGIIRFGKFTLKSGIESPFYIDMRTLCAYPSIMRDLSTIVSESIRNEDFQHICGVPYAALAMGTLVSQEMNLPQILMRKEQKKHGTKKNLEGVFKAQDKVVLIDDVITSGVSFLEAARKLEKENLIPHLLLCIIDREQGGEENLKKHGYKTISIFKISEIVEILYSNKKITAIEHQAVLNFVQGQKVALPTENKETTRPTYTELLEQSQHHFSKRLLEIVINKKSNLCFSADLNDKTELLKITREVAPHIALLKIHADIIVDFDTAFITDLKRLSEEHGFLILEDRKFADIGNTAWNQYYSGHHKIASWADAITVHVIAGSSSVQALAKNDHGHIPAMILISQMSTQGTLTDANYQKSAVAIAKEYPNLIVGIVSQSKQYLSGGQLHFTPGIKLQAGVDSMGQQYDPPAKAFSEKGTDMLIVGRGIYQSKNPKESAANYQKIAWDAYTELT